MKQLKILRVITRLNVGGPSLHVQVLAEGLERRGYQVTGVDNSPAMIRQAQAKAPRQARFLLQDARSLQLPEPAVEDSSTRRYDH